MIKEYDKYGFRFRKWDIYKDARELRVTIIKLLSTYPKEEKYALIDQTKRALNSIILNTAEGSNKETDKETKLYIARAANSLDEVVACIDCALDDGYVLEKTHQEILEKASSLAKRYKAFVVKLTNSLTVK